MTCFPAPKVQSTSRVSEESASSDVLEIIPALAPRSGVKTNKKKGKSPIIAATWVWELAMSCAVFPGHFGDSFLQFRPWWFLFSFCWHLRGQGGSARDVYCATTGWDLWQNRCFDHCRSLTVSHGGCGRCSKFPILIGTIMIKRGLSGVGYPIWRQPYSDI